MRAEFARALVDLRNDHPEVVVLTGDLGFMALEAVRDRYGERFINAGVAEQNMVCVAAGLAREGLQPWVYNIAPFAVLRPYEQIRNDVCHHRLPVKLVGNGGGYGYGIMGATHHALEDIGAMRVLPHMRVYVPLVASDVAEAVDAMAADPAPNYLRLNLAAALPHLPGPFSPWRRIAAGDSGVAVGTGPVVANLCALIEGGRVPPLDVWAASVFPLPPLPAELVAAVNRTRRLLTLEEHAGPCGLGEALARLLLDRLDGRITFRGLCAAGYPGGRYGSQRWHQEQSGLAGDPLVDHVLQVLYG